MPVKVVGSIEHYERIRTGSWSFDHALAGGPRGILIPGFPTRTITELSGKMMAGKSTFATWLAGRVAGKGKIAAAFIEEYDEQMIEEGYWDGSSWTDKGIREMCK